MTEEEKFLFNLKVDHVAEMKDPIIIINEKDYEKLVLEVEGNMIGLMVGDSPSYNGISIVETSVMKEGEMVVYDKRRVFEYN